MNTALTTGSATHMPNEVCEAQQPTIYVYVIEQHAEASSVSDDSDLVDRIKAYLWQATFAPDECILRTNHGSCPMVMLCAAEIADVCGGWGTRHSGANEPNCTLCFEPPQDKSIFPHDQGFDARPLNHNEKALFQSWYDAATTALQQGKPLLFDPFV